MVSDEPESSCRTLLGRVLRRESRTEQHSNVSAAGRLLREESHPIDPDRPGASDPDAQVELVPRRHDAPYGNLLPQPLRGSEPRLLADVRGRVAVEVERGLQPQLQWESSNAACCQPSRSPDSCEQCTRVGRPAGILHDVRGIAHPSVARQRCPRGHQPGRASIANARAP